MMKQLKQLGIGSKVVGGDGICTPELAKLAGDALGDAQVYCGEAGGVLESQKAELDKFNVAYRKRFGMDSDLFAPNAYDAMNVLAAAMVKAGSIEPVKYLPALAATNGFKGVTGSISFDEKGDIRNGALTLSTFKSGTKAHVATTK
jgi:branched-chain amino acid transport system substrate-binding protein